MSSEEYSSPVDKLIIVKVKKKEDNHRQKTAHQSRKLSKLPVLIQFHLQPRSVKQRIENCQLLEQYNLGYQDDVFAKISPIKRKVRLLTTS